MSRLTTLMQLTDSALPTGAFSHSFGLEAYLESGQVHDERTLLDWLDAFLSTQLTFTDAVAVRRACRSGRPHPAEVGSYGAEVGSGGAEVGSGRGTDLGGPGPDVGHMGPDVGGTGPDVGHIPPDLGDTGPDVGHIPPDLGGLEALDAELTALLIPAQIRAASLKMGRRILEIARDSFPSAGVKAYAEAVADNRCTGHYTIAFAVAGAGQGLDEETLVEAYLYSTLTALTYNAVRAIPLGQLAGQRILATLRTKVPSAVARSRTADPRHFGAAASALEIHQMRHEHQRARMFMS
ncbi:MAG TPA: urease accessory protein UreF [Sinomonas sp.]|nr:urease accessory protein UreF [Sinomonas sp.]